MFLIKNKDMQTIAFCSSISQLLAMAEKLCFIITDPKVLSQTEVKSYYDGKTYFIFKI